MSYSTYSDVVKLLKDQTFSDTSKITNTDITEIISRIDAYLDSRLYAIYNLPITGTQALLIMENLSIKLSGAEVWARLHPANLGEGETDWASRWRKEALEYIEQLLKGEATLPDASPIAVGEKDKSNLMASGVAELAETDDGYNPFFTVGDTY